jgi:predicted NAD/FAD-binding protein
VTIFEREAAVGMDAHSLDAHGARMDIPLRVFSESYYPNLCSIYKHLGVKYRHADYSFSCRPAAAAASYFRYINFFVADMALPMPLCLNVRELFKCVRLAFQFAHFVNRAPAKLAAEAGELRLGTFLERHGYSKEFATCLLYPMLSVVCTCSYASVEAYPASIVVDYFANKYGLSGAQCRAYEGTRDVVDRITQPVERVITSATITRVDAAQPFAGGRERALGVRKHLLSVMGTAERANALLRAMTRDGRLHPGRAPPLKGPVVGTDELEVTPAWADEVEQMVTGKLIPPRS